MTPSSFNCSTHIQFAGSVNQAAYTPSVFATPSSLSHLEDMCHTPTSYPDDEYYVMSNSNNTGATFMKRYLKTEERKVLCDIGYTVNTTYGNAANLNFFNYGGSTCPGLQVAGINDGITSSGFFQYTVTVGNTIPVTGILSNDFNAVSFECLEDIYGNGNPDVTSGTSFNYAATTSGTALLRYIPVSSSGKRGNITYILIYVQSGNCVPNACDIVSNGGFENGTNCGSLNNINCPTPVGIECWNALSGTPDLLARGCIPATSCGSSAYTIPTTLASPTADTWNSSTTINNNALHLFSSNANLPTSTLNEAIQGKLNTPLQSGVAYTLKFVARVANNGGSANLPGVLEFGGGTNLLAPINFFYNSIPATLTSLAQVQVPNNNAWNHFSVPISNSTASNINFITIINAGYLNGNPSITSNKMIIDDVSIIETNQAATLNLPTTLCINQVLPDLSLYANPPGGVFTGNGVTLNAGIYSFNPSLAGAGNHMITYTYTSNTGCVYDISATVTVVNANINLATTATQSTICLGEPSTLTASGASSYVWNPGNFSGNPYIVTPTTTTTYTATGTDANGCSATSSVTVTVDQNCGTCTTCIPLATSGTLSTHPGSGKTYCINNDITITGNVNFISSEFKIAPNVTITVDATATLNIYGSHLYACDEMWQGIVVKPGGKVTVQSITSAGINRSSLIEDAFIAIDIPSSSLITNNPLTVRNATFNRNQVAIRISKYSKASGSITYPMSVVNTVFTSRDIPFTPNSLVWPHTNTIKAPFPVPPLKSPYINDATFSATNSNAFLKAPFSPNSAKPQAGIRLILVGASTPVNSPTPTYYEMKIGAAGGFNVFDNLLIGIDAVNSNFTCVNNVFQNNPTNQKIGMAINARAEQTNNRLRVMPAAANNFTNKFYDVGRAVNTVNYFEHLVTNCEVRSTWVSTAPTASPSVFNGKYGFYVLTNRFKSINISTNTMYNIENGITFNANFGSYNVGGGVPNGQYSGQVDINSNIIRPNLPSSPVTTQYVANAITVSNGSSTILAFIPGSTVNINNNTLTDVYRGIASSTWNKKDVKINDNTISLVPDPFTVNPLQYGIGIQANKTLTVFGNSIVGNTVTGFGVTSNTKVRAIITSLCSNQQVRCNNVSNTYNGIEFNGDNAPTSFTKNNMQTHRYGLVLDNNSFIGVQGDITTPSDNLWLGTWNLPNYKTATLGGSTAIGNTLWVRKPPSAFNPDGSGTSTTGSSAVYSNANNTVLYITNNPIVTSCTTLTPCCPDDGKIARLEQIVQDQELLMNRVAETRYINKNKVHRMLRDDPSLLTESVILQDFYTQSLTTNRENFVAIEDDFAVSDLVGASAKTSSLLVENNIEQNYKIFFESYLKQQTDTITVADSLTLVTLAMGCPFTDGEVVYQARVLFNAIYSSNVVFEDNCTSENLRLSGLTENSIGVLTDLKVNIFPNPTTGETTLIMDGESSEWLIVISDIQGRKIHEKTYTANKINLKLVADNGVYYVQVTNIKNNETITKKLIISK
jgi:hypothetical protein